MEAAILCVYALPCAPLVANLVLLAINRRIVGEPLDRGENDRSETRTLALSLGALSFGGLVGVAALTGPGSPYVLPAVYFLALSFVMLFGSVALQSYKFTRLEDVLSDGLLRSGEMGLMMAVGGLLLRVSAGGWRGWVLAILVVGVAAVDAGRHLQLQSKFLKGVRDARATRKTG